jgi:hypothetical protein
MIEIPVTPINTRENTNRTGEKYPIVNTTANPIAVFEKINNKVVRPTPMTIAVHQPESSRLLKSR